MKTKLWFIGGLALLCLFAMPHVQASAKILSLKEQAEALIGTPYEKGGTDPKNGFDSSGFIQYLFKHAKAVDLPRKVVDQHQLGERVSLNEAEPGDLVYFRSLEEKKDTPIHVALYIGNQQIIHTTLSKGVIVTDLSQSTYWKERYDVTKRLPTTQRTSNEKIVKDAMTYLGIPYVFGSADPKGGFDCSGFLQYVFGQSLGIYLPRSAQQQWMVGEKVNMKNIRPGDFIFFSNTYKQGISHVGMYVGDNRFIHASRSESVTISYLSESYWREKFTGVKRLTGLKLAKQNPVVSEAAMFLGEVCYVKGGTTPKEGFDTAGFTQYVYKKALGIELPRYAAGQLKAGTTVGREELKPGDLVFFSGSYLTPAIYAGAGQVIQMTISNGVVITNMNTSTYWKDKYETAVRVK
ncbi:C40 family peptidase [Bacillus sp. NPDC077027]|uniref:C40 family peptidase n=1 Tax=Bacillus sp. NPDC077027 TaxID=3390548 RepID=UPI003D067091